LEIDEITNIRRKERRRERRGDRKEKRRGGREEKRRQGKELTCGGLLEHRDHDRVETGS
jgi:hypothetical protein